MTSRNAKPEVRAGRTGERGMSAGSGEDVRRSRFIVDDAEIRAALFLDGTIEVEFERDGRVLLTWVSPPRVQEEPKPPAPPAPPPAPVQPISLPVPPRSEPNPNEEDRLLRVEEVAAKLRLSRTTVYRMAAEGKLPSIRIAFSRRFSPSAIDAWLAEHRGELVEAGDD